MTGVGQPGSYFLSHACRYLILIQFNLYGSGGLNNYPRMSSTMRGEPRFTSFFIEDILVDKTTKNNSNSNNNNSSNNNKTSNNGLQSLQLSEIPHQASINRLGPLGGGVSTNSIAVPSPWRASTASSRHRLQAYLNVAAAASTPLAAAVAAATAFAPSQVQRHLTGMQPVYSQMPTGVEHAFMMPPGGHEGW